MLMPTSLARALPSVLLGLAVVAAEPAAAKNATDEPFQVSLSNVALSTPPSTFHVPADRRLVIEFVSASCEPDVTTMLVRTTVNGAQVFHRFFPPLDSVRPNGVTQQTRIYADPDTDVVLQTERRIGPSQGCFASLSGLLSLP